MCGCAFGEGWRSNCVMMWWNHCLFHRKRRFELFCALISVQLKYTVTMSFILIVDVLVVRFVTKLCADCWWKVLFLVSAANFEWNCKFEVNMTHSTALNAEKQLNWDTESICEHLESNSSKKGKFRSVITSRKIYLIFSHSLDEPNVFQQYKIT